MNCSVAVNDLEANDRLADKAPIPMLSARPVHVRRENAANALCVVRRQGLKCQTVFQQEPHNFSHTRASFESHLLLCQILPNHAAEFVQ